LDSEKPVHLFHAALVSFAERREITMKFPTKYTLALQILSICYLYNNEKITSGFIANHTGADASIIRYTMLDLKKRNLIDSKPGPGGTTLNCDLSKISLYDVYELVSEPTETTLKYYDFPETATAIDKEIKKATELIFDNIKDQVFAVMKNTCVLEICGSLQIK
uniref:Rrf2 family transcriptional regulator n=1 Tax=Roseburia hominis TaxID=301301 RepID=UPI001F2DF8BD